MRFAIFFLVLLTSVNVFAQIEATTKEGKEVMLYDDGTWEFVVKDTMVVNTIINDQIKNESEIEELYYVVSPRLRKYFGELKGKIRSRSKCSVDNGQAKIYFQWEVILGDAYRYFGYIKPGKKVTLKTKNNKDIALVLTEDIDYEVVSKYNYSVFKGACLVSPEQLDQLLKYQVTEIEVDWKKNPETYSLNNPYYFKDTFASLLSD